MTVTTHDVIDNPPPPLKRDGWGRPYVVPPTGGKPVAYTRCTTFVDALDSKFTLGQWQQRMVALGLAERPDLLLAVTATERDDKKALNSLCEQAQEAAKAHAAATTGTALHALTERIDTGRPLGVVPEAYQADLDAYRITTAELDVVMVEQFVVCDDLTIGGTPDRVVRHGDRAYIADVKTGSDIDLPALKIAQQLAVYSRSVPYDHVGQVRFDYPTPVDQEWGLVIHLPAGRGECTLYWIDLTRGWEAVQCSAQVRRWRRTTGLYRPFTPASGTTQPGALELALESIRNASDVDVLREQYRLAVGCGLDKDTITNACLTRRAELERKG